MSGKIKIELIAKTLFENSHDVEILSPGGVVENKWTYYRAFSEPLGFHPDIPVFYASVLPIRRLNGTWSDLRTLQLFKSRHRQQPYDVVIILNLDGPQVTCASYAARRLRLPVILEYEDDRFVDIFGAKLEGLLSRCRNRRCERLLKTVSGCMAVSPHLLSQVPEGIPTMLLRGVAAEDVVIAGNRSGDAKKNWVLFSGTHVPSNGVVQLVGAWKRLRVPNWELHITGYGQLTDTLRSCTEGVPGIHFHGLVDRRTLVELMVVAKICINPHGVSETPGNVFAFKIIEYIAAGAHVVSTPMGKLEPEIERGITYMPNNDPDTIAATLTEVIEKEMWKRQARSYVVETYSTGAIAKPLDALVLTAVGACPPPGHPGTRRSVDAANGFGRC
jgi:hypothetical protein